MQNNTEIVVDSLKNMLARAMLLGMSVGQKGISDSVFDEKNSGLVFDVASLAESTHKFLLASGLDQVETDSVIPLYKEISTQRPLGRE